MLDLSLLLAQLLVVLAAARLAGWLARPLGQPRVVGEIVAGLALGPSVLGALAPGAAHALFPADRLLPLAALSQLGVVLFMFAVGLRLDRGVLLGRARAAVAVSHASIVVPVAFGALMNTRGLMELVVLNVGLELRVLSPTLFAMMVLMALTTTCVTTPLLALALRHDRVRPADPVTSAAWRAHLWKTRAPSVPTSRTARSGCSCSSSLSSCSGR